MGKILGTQWNHSKDFDFNQIVMDRPNRTGHLLKMNTYD